MGDEATIYLAEMLKAYAADAPSPEHARVAVAASGELESLLAGKPTRRQSFIRWGKRALQAAALSTLLLGAGYLSTAGPQRAQKPVTRPAAVYTMPAPISLLPQPQVIPPDVFISSPRISPDAYSPWSLPTASWSFPGSVPSESQIPKVSKAVPQVSQEPTQITRSLLPERTAIPAKTSLFMYHNIGEVQDRFTVSADTLRRHLEYFDRHNYQPITFSQYASGDYTLKSGKRPVVLTFDDSSAGQCRILPDGRIDPRSAFGVMEEYNMAHPGFKAVGTYFINIEDRQGLPPFGQEGLVQEKLERIVAQGSEIGYHGYKHHDFKRLTPSDVRADIALFNAAMDHYFPGYEVKSFAYPFGSLPGQQVQQIIERDFPYTAHAWGGSAQGQQVNVPRIETGPATRLAQYAPAFTMDPVLLAEAPHDGNVYKEKQNLSRYARNHPQLPSQHPQTIRQPDDRGRGRSGLQGEGDSARRQDSALQYWQEGDQGRGPLVAWQQGGLARPLRDWYAGSSDRRDSPDPVSYFFQPFIFKNGMPVLYPKIDFIGN